MSWCQLRDAATDAALTCSPAAAMRSYALPYRWPFPGRLRLVMETEPGTCNLYGDKEACCAMTGPRVENAVERHTTEVIAAFLSGCAERYAQSGTRCHAADIGANNGWMSAYMLSLGAHVVSVEPQPDLAQAVRETAALNCWANRSVVHNAFACASEHSSHSGKHCMKPKVVRDKWRVGGVPKGQRERVLGRLVGGMALETVLTAERARPAHYELIKLDGDGPEAYWMNALNKMVHAGAVSVENIVVEANGMTGAFGASILRGWQQDGYDVYRLDVADHRRILGGNGWDVLSPPGTYARLDRFAAWARDRLEEEMLMVRGMRHLFRVKDNLTLAEWTLVVKALTGSVYSAPHFLITKDAALRTEVRWRPPASASVRRGAAWKAAEQWAAPLVSPSAGHRRDPRP